MWSWFTFWLFLHILAVIVAFGPTVTFGPIASYAQKHPQWSVPSTGIIELLEKRLVVPLAIVVPFLGVALIFTAHIDLWHSEWLIISIVLYTFVFFFAILVQVPNTTKMLRALEALPPGPPPAGASGPPPHIAALGKRLQLGGFLLSALVATILLLMIWKPGNA